jgi:hypothetical protein
MVLALRIVLRKISLDFSPESKPNQFGGMPVSSVAYPVYEKK